MFEEIFRNMTCQKTPTCHGEKTFPKKINNFGKKNSQKHFCFKTPAITVHNDIYNTDDSEKKHEENRTPNSDNRFLSHKFQLVCQKSVKT